MLNQQCLRSEFIEKQRTNVCIICMLFGQFHDMGDEVVGNVLISESFERKQICIVYVSHNKLCYKHLTNETKTKNDKN